jgi:hypothetical protein
MSVEGSFQILFLCFWPHFHDNHKWKVYILRSLINNLWDNIRHNFRKIYKLRNQFYNFLICNCPILIFEKIVKSNP